MTEPNHQATNFSTFSQAENGQAKTPPKKPVIAGYTILEFLGQGGMGVVWRALQDSTQREVALKVIHSHRIGSERARFRFTREVELSARLEHVNIARVYASGVHQDSYYYAMELIDGLPLDLYLEEHKLTHDDTIELLLTLCGAVEYAHQRGVIHRDLKPSNILVSPDGQAHVLDFGLAKDSLQTNIESIVSLEGDLLGTPAYMSPELAVGDQNQVDTRSDIYTLGVILYRAISGGFPYPVKSSFIKVLETIREVEPKPLREVCSEVDADLEAIIMKMLAKDPDERYQSMAELRHDLRCQQRGLPIQIKSNLSLYVLLKLMKHHRYTSTVVLLLMIIVVGFLGIYAYLYGQLRESHSQLLERDRSIAAQTKQFELIGAHILFVDHFLPAWFSDELVKAQGVTQYFGQRSREARAASILLKTELFLESWVSFQEQCEDVDAAFLAFVEGEYYLKEGQGQLAQKAYERCISYKLFKADQYYMERAKGRLYELGLTHE